MRTGCAVGTIVFAIAACGSSSAAPAPPPGAHPATAECGPHSARTVAINGQARVYSSGGGVYGCATATGHSYLLGRTTSRPGQPRLGKLALAGRVVAYGETAVGVDTASAEVLVRRLDDGRRTRNLAAMSQPIGPEAFQSVDSIVVKADGAVAWIAVARSIIRHSAESEVDRADGGGRSRLATGPGITSTSLRLNGSRVTWRDHGAVGSANLR